ncbi:MAG: hypothetical protein ACKOQ8_07715 [Micrococcales bacterium]
MSEQSLDVAYETGYRHAFAALTRAVDAILFDANKDKEIVPFEIVAAISDKMQELKPDEH